MEFPLRTLNQQELSGVVKVPNVALPPGVKSIDKYLSLHSTSNRNGEKQEFAQDKMDVAQVSNSARLPSSKLLTDSKPDCDYTTMNKSSTDKPPFNHKALNRLAPRCVQELEEDTPAPNVSLLSDPNALSDCLAFQLSKLKGTNSNNLKSTKKPPLATNRRLCRHHSDCDRQNGERLNKCLRARRGVRRSISAIETNKIRYRPPRVRRSISERSSLMMAGKHLVPPRSGSVVSTYSSRCSSVKTLSSNVSLSDIVAVEMGIRDVPGLTPKEARRKRVVCTVMVVFVTLLILSVILIVVTLFLSPEVDDILRKGNEEIYRSMSAGASTSSPTTEAANTTTPSSGTPG